MGRFIHNRRGRLAAGAAAVSILLAVAGCGEEPLDPNTFRQTEFAQFSALLSELAMAEREAQRFAGCFVDGAAPAAAQRSKYAPPTAFELAAPPEISGDTATLSVNVMKIGEHEKREVVGQATWTAVQVDGAWFLKDVPLP